MKIWVLLELHAWKYPLGAQLNEQRHSTQQEREAAERLANTPGGLGPVCKQINWLTLMLPDHRRTASTLSIPSKLFGVATSEIREASREPYSLEIRPERCRSGNSSARLGVGTTETF